MSGSILCDFERWVSVPAPVVRSEFGTLLRRSGFTLDAEQVSLIEATRGSHLASSAMMLSKLPMAAIVRIAPGEGGTGISVRLEDRWKTNLGKFWSLNSSYRSIFEQVQVAIDDTLARLDPPAAQAFGPPRWWSAAPDARTLEQANVAVGTASEKVVRTAARLLEGRSKPRAPRAWKGTTGARFQCPAGVADFDLASLQERLTVAALVAAHPGSMPAPLAAQLEAFAARVEAALEASGGGAVALQVSDDERKILEFLNMQARIRDSLPLRIMTTCQDCHFQKVTNPDLERLRRRNDRLRNLTSGLGATFSKGGASPFVVFGTFFRMHSLDPDFVCPRCQGMHGAGRIVTFCPGCGERRDEAVLLKCKKCSHDFRTDIPREPLWQDAAAPWQPPVQTSQG